MLHSSHCTIYSNVFARDMVSELNATDIRTTLDVVIKLRVYLFFIFIYNNFFFNYIYMYI